MVGLIRVTRAPHQHLQDGCSSDWPLVGWIFLEIVFICLENLIGSHEGMEDHSFIFIRKTWFWNFGMWTYIVIYNLHTLTLLIECNLPTSPNKKNKSMGKWSLEGKVGPPVHQSTDWLWPVTLVIVGFLSNWLMLDAATWGPHVKTWTPTTHASVGYSGSIFISWCFDL